MSFLDRIPLTLAFVGAFTLGLAPFFPEPHIWEKFKMLVAGIPLRPMDIFDLAFHTLPWLLLIAKLARLALSRS
jgi:hypothetical protein